MVKVNVQKPKVSNRGTSLEERLASLETFARDVVKTLEDLASEINNKTIVVKNGNSTYYVNIVNISGAGATVSTISGVTSVYIP